MTTVLASVLSFTDQHWKIDGTVDDVSSEDIRSLLFSLNVALIGKYASETSGECLSESTAEQKRQRRVAAARGRSGYYDKSKAVTTEGGITLVDPSKLPSLVDLERITGVSSSLYGFSSLFVDDNPVLKNLALTVSDLQFLLSHFFSVKSLESSGVLCYGSFVTLVSILFETIAQGTAMGSCYGASKPYDALKGWEQNMILNSVLAQESRNVMYEDIADADDEPAPPSHANGTRENEALEVVGVIRDETSLFDPLVSGDVGDVLRRLIETGETPSLAKLLNDARKMERPVVYELFKRSLQVAVEYNERLESSKESLRTLKELTGGSETSVNDDNFRSENLSFILMDRGRAAYNPVFAPLPRETAIPASDFLLNPYILASVLVNSLPESNELAVNSSVNLIALLRVAAKDEDSRKSLRLSIEKADAVGWDARNARIFKAVVDELVKLYATNCQELLNTLARGYYPAEERQGILKLLNRFSPVRYQPTAIVLVSIDDSFDRGVFQPIDDVNVFYTSATRDDAVQRQYVRANLDADVTEMWPKLRTFLYDKESPQYHVRLFEKTVLQSLGTEPSPSASDTHPVFLYRNGKLIYPHELEPMLKFVTETVNEFSFRMPLPSTDESKSTKTTYEASAHVLILPVVLALTRLTSVYFQTVMDATQDDNIMVDVYRKVTEQYLSRCAEMRGGDTSEGAAERKTRVTSLQRHVIKQYVGHRARRCLSKLKREILGENSDGDKAAAGELLYDGGKVDDKDCWKRDRRYNEVFNERLLNGMLTHYTDVSKYSAMHFVATICFNVGSLQECVSRTSQLARAGKILPSQISALDDDADNTFLFDVVPERSISNQRRAIYNRYSVARQSTNGASNSALTVKQYLDMTPNDRDTFRLHLFVTNGIAALVGLVSVSLNVKVVEMCNGKLFSLVQSVSNMIFKRDVTRNSAEDEAKKLIADVASNATRETATKLRRLADEGNYFSRSLRKRV